MADFRKQVSALGWEHVATYIQSGNLVFDADCSAAEAEAALEALIRTHHGYEAPAIVRTRDQWAGYPTGNPFPGVAESEPNRLVLLLSKAPPNADAAEAIQARAQHDETVRLAGDALWIHFPFGQGESKLTPALIDRAVGSTATARNYRTVAILLDMLDA